MNDIQKISETHTKDEGDWEEWPFPTVEIESVISGELRSRILSKLSLTSDAAELRLVETCVSGGYSEYTQEDDCDIELKAGTAVVWRANTGDTDSSMARFLKEFG